MRFDDYLHADQGLTDRLGAAPSAEAKTSLLNEAIEAGEQALGAAQSRAEQVEITMRLAATSALAAAADNSTRHAESTVIWAKRCGRLLDGAAAEAYYLPRLASLVGGVASLLDEDMRHVVVAGLRDWLGRAGVALEAVSKAEREGDAYARVALAAVEVESAYQLAAEARQHAKEAYLSAGRPDLGGTFS